MHRSTLMVVVLATALIAGACLTWQSSQRGPAPTAPPPDIPVSTNVPADCAVIGVAYGHGEGADPDGARAQARDQLKRNAARAKADHVRPNVSETLSVDGARYRVVLSGRIYRCGALASANLGEGAHSRCIIVGKYGNGSQSAASCQGGRVRELGSPVDEPAM